MIDDKNNLGKFMNLRSFLLRNFDHNNTKIVILISCFVSLIFGYITPLDVMLNNQKDFIVEFHDTIICMILPTIQVFLLVFFVLTISLMMHNKVFDIVKLMIIGVVVASYIQELFLNNYIVRGEKNSFVGDVSDKYIRINLLIFICIGLIPAFLYGVTNLQFKNKLNKNKSIKFCFNDKIILVLTVLVMLMKVSGMVSSYISNNPKKYHVDKELIQFASFESTVSFSKNNNIYVFIVDRFDSLWCDEFLDMYPEMNEKLDGFTFYQNNSSHYSCTFPSIVTMLTNTTYDESEWFSFLDDSWNKKNALNVLKENGYSVNMILDKPNVYGKTSNILKYADNFKKPENLRISIDAIHLRKILMGLTMSRVLPYKYKFKFDYVLKDLSNGDYVEYTFHNKEHYFTEDVCTKSDCLIYDYVNNYADFNANSQKNVFTVIHLNGAHDVNYELMEKSNVSNYGNDQLATVRANFETIFKYIEETKKLGIYNKTTFIILADHGYYKEKKEGTKNKLKSPDLPVLLIKPVNTESAELKYDSVSTLSNDMFSASILDYAGLDHSDFGLSYRDVINNSEVVLREFKTYKWRGVGKVVPNETYVINGDARDFNNWQNVYNDNG